jgi:hypothetical protein
MHFLWYLWIAYFWSSDKGNGPEALQQALVALILAVIFVPLVRKFIKREFAHIHAKVDHVIKHAPGVPSFHHPDFPSVHSVTAPPDVHDAVAHDATAVHFPPPVPTDGTVAP